MVSVGDESTAIHVGDLVRLPQNEFHRFWTTGESMDALAVALLEKAGPALVRVDDRRALARNAAQRFTLAAERAMEAHGYFSVALSGGSTPRDLYALLATPEFAEHIDWEHVHLFWGDERAVPPDDAQSNFRMVEQTLLAHVPIPSENVHRIAGEEEPARAARAYADELRSFFKPAENELPHFDLMLLGLGENGHTASLFPHTAVLHNTTDWVAAEYIPEVGMNRITLTAPVINASENILFLVAGAEKATVVRAVLRGEYRPEDLPSQLINPKEGSLVWLLDRAAAAQLVLYKG
jgi:6-phosphogluconolactonase